MGDTGVTNYVYTPVNLLSVSSPTRNPHHSTLCYEAADNKLS